MMCRNSGYRVHWIKYFHRYLKFGNLYKINTFPWTLYERGEKGKKYSNNTEKIRQDISTHNHILLYPHFSITNNGTWNSIRSHPPRLSRSQLIAGGCGLSHRTMPRPQRRYISIHPRGLYSPDRAKAQLRRPTAPRNCLFITYFSIRWHFFRKKFHWQTLVKIVGAQQSDMMKTTLLVCVFIKLPICELVFNRSIDIFNNPLNNCKL